MCCPAKASAGSTAFLWTATTKTLEKRMPFNLPRSLDCPKKKPKRCLRESVRFARWDNTFGSDFCSNSISFTREKKHLSKRILSSLSCFCKIEEFSPHSGCFFLAFFAAWNTIKNNLFINLKIIKAMKMRIFWISHQPQLLKKKMIKAAKSI